MSCIFSFFYGIKFFPDHNINKTLIENKTKCSNIYNREALFASPLPSPAQYWQRMSNITVRNVSLEDGGNYSCVMSSPVGRAQALQAILLAVLSRPAVRLRWGNPPLIIFSLLTSYFSLPTSHFPLPTSHFSLLTSHFPLPTSHFSLVLRMEPNHPVVEGSKEIICRNSIIFPFLADFQYIIFRWTKLSAQPQPLSATVSHCQTQTEW